MLGKNLVGLLKNAWSASNLLSLSDIDQAKKSLCPSTPQSAKYANNFFGIMFKAHDAIDNNKSFPNYPTWDLESANPFVENNNKDETQVFSDVTFASDDTSFWF